MLFCVQESDRDRLQRLIGSGAQLMAGGHVFDDPDIPVIRQARSAKGITIEDGAWIGTGAIILDGVVSATIVSWEPGPSSTKTSRPGR